MARTVNVTFAALHIQEKCQWGVTPWPLHHIYGPELQWYHDGMLARSLNDGGSSKAFRPPTASRRVLCWPQRYYAWMRSLLCFQMPSREERTPLPYGIALLGKSPICGDARPKQRPWRKLTATSCLMMTALSTQVLRPIDAAEYGKLSSACDANHMVRSKQKSCTSLRLA